MTKYLNYVDGVLTVNTYRSPYASVTDFDDVITSASLESEQRLVCTLDGSELDKLESNYYQNSGVTSGTIDRVYDLIKEGKTMSDV